MSAAAARRRTLGCADLRKKLRGLAGQVPGVPVVEADAPLGETPASSALLHHAAYELERAGSSRDADRLRDAFEVAAAADRLTADGPRTVPLLVIDSRHCRETDDERFGSRVYAVTPAALAAADPVPPSLVKDAEGALHDAGAGHYLVHGVGIAVLCEPVAETGNTAFSYTLGAFPHTVFTDWAPDPVILGESLAHEGAHSWLNAALAAAGERLPPEPLAYSPWKDSMRPAFGLIHAGLAFSVLTSYFRASIASPYASAETRRYCEVRADVERRRVAMARDSIEAALAHVRSQDIVDAVRAEMEWALESDLAGAR